MSPKTSFVIVARPFENAALVLPAAISPTAISRKPMMPAVKSARITARGAVRRGSAVSSASEPAVSNPYIT